MDKLKDAIKQCVRDCGSTALFLVDELDRCRPDYAISYLETIKHLFDVEGAVFLLAADRGQLESSAKAAFGAKLDFEEYYRKFVHREIALPEISDAGYKRLALAYTEYYMEREGLRYCYANPQDQKVYTAEIVVDLFVALKFTPRQIQGVFRILGHLFSIDEQPRGHIAWCWFAASAFMAALKIGKNETYENIGYRRLDLTSAMNVLKRLTSDTEVSWWLCLLWTGNGLEIGEKSEQDMLNLTGASKEELATFWRKGWGMNSGTASKFVEARKKIDQVARWKYVAT